MTAVLLAALHDLLTVPESLVTAGRGRPARHHRAQLRQHRRRGGGPVDATSGYWAERDQSLNDGDNFTHYLKQAVVLFPTVEKAGAFFDASAHQWPACRQYSHTHSGSQWSVGQISNANGTLSTTATQQNASAPGWGCGRAPCRSPACSAWRP